MASIPEEIWLQIFKLVQNARSRTTGRGAKEQLYYDMARAASVRPLTETCLAFHRICLPLLFETIVINGYSDRGRRRARCLADVLHRKARLKKMVSRVHIYALDSMSKELRDIMEMVIVGLWFVRDMRIEGAYLSTRLLGQPLRLERLVLIEVYPSKTEGATIHSFDSLKYLRCGPDGFGKTTTSFAALVVPQLETLQIDTAYLTGARGYQKFRFNPAVLKKIIIESNSAWSAGMEEGLVELLQRASRIKSLELPLESFRPGSGLPDDTITDLEAFSGRADHVLAFCEGRPVRDLHATFTGFTWSIMTEEVPNLIRPGSVSLEHLHLDWMVWEDGAIEYIAQQCPQLVSLKIRVGGGHRNGAITTRFSMPGLRRATFLSLPGPNPWYHGNHDGCMAEKEDKLLQESREFWPQLGYLRLHPKHFWTYRDLGGGWVQVKDVE